MSVFIENTIFVIQNGVKRNEESIDKIIIFSDL